MLSILVLLIPISVAIIAIAVGFFFWAVKSGQFDDLDSPAYRILDDDDHLPPATEDRTEYTEPRR